MESDEAAAAAASPQASGGTVTPAPKKRGRKPKNKDESQEQISGGKMKESGKKTKQEEQSVDEKYSQWKGLVPILYDWLANHNLVWPSLSCRSLLFSLRLGFQLMLSSVRSRVERSDVDSGLNRNNAHT